MVDGVKDSVGDVQDRHGEMTVDVMSYKAKNKKNALFMVAVTNLLKEIIQKRINDEAARAELLQKLEAALEEAQAAESSKAFWEKLREGVLADIERQLKAMNDKNAEKVSAKVEALQQQLDHFFLQAQTTSALIARFEAEYPAIMDSIAAISADLDNIEDALDAPITEPEELITLSEQVADIRKNYTAVRGRFDYYLQEIQEAVRQLNAAAAAVQDPGVAGVSVVPSISIVSATPSVHPIAPAAAVPSIAAPAPKPSLIVDDSTRELLDSFGVPKTLFVNPQQKLDYLEKALNGIGLRIGATEERIVTRAKQYPGLEIRNNPNGISGSPHIFFKRPRDEEELRSEALFRPRGFSRGSFE